MRIRFTYIVVFALLFSLAGDVLTSAPEGLVREKICDLTCLDCAIRDTAEAAVQNKKTAADNAGPKTAPPGLVCAADKTGALNCYLRLEAAIAKPPTPGKKPRPAPK